MLAEEIQAATLGATMAARQKGGHMTIDSDAPHPPRTRYAPRLRLLFAWVMLIMIMSFLFCSADSHPAWGLGDGHDDVHVEYDDVGYGYDADAMMTTMIQIMMAMIMIDAK